MRVRMGWRGWSFCDKLLGGLTCERPDRLTGASAGLSVAVTVAVSMIITVL